MFANPARRLRPPRRETLRPANHLIEALQLLADGRALLLGHTEIPWASITFEGARHMLELRFEGLEAITAGERLIVALPEHEFAIPGQIVADATVTAVDHRLEPGPVLTVACELLLLRDA